jgi:hypothetical protein
MDTIQATRELCRALDADPRAVQQDPLGDWCVTGTTGAMYTHEDGTLLLHMRGSSADWRDVQKALVDCCVTTHADADNRGGFLELGRLPTCVEAISIRAAAGIPFAWFEDPANPGGLDRPLLNDWHSARETKYT